MSGLFFFVQEKPDGTRVIFTSEDAETLFLFLKNWTKK
jgi:hypothetical protein